MNAEQRQAKRILILDDSSDMREIYKSFFKGHSDEFKIDVEGDAHVAIQRLKRETFDLIVLDIIMEPMTGEAFLMYARENKSSENTPIIVVSVLSESILKSLKRFKAVHFLQKPVTEVQLITAINQHIG